MSNENADIIPSLNKPENIKDFSFLWMKKKEGKRWFESLTDTQLKANPGGWHAFISGSMVDYYETIKSKGNPEKDNDFLEYITAASLFLVEKFCS